ncbi:hypothetical protein PFISCL1PPCAC_28439, partial [Pristionchus fissidentatus]
TMNRLLLSVAVVLTLLAVCRADETQRVKLRKEWDEKLATLSAESRAASKRFDEILEQKLNRKETKAAMDKVMASLPDNVKKELETTRPIKNGKPLTSTEFFDIME